MQSNSVVLTQTQYIRLFSLHKLQEDESTSMGDPEFYIHPSPAEIMQTVRFILNDLRVQSAYLSFHVFVGTTAEKIDTMTSLRRT
eukprot:1351588-Amorphochlora_amoeboformis.AAC.1